MLNALRRNGIMLGGMVICGLLCLMARPAMLSHRGSVGPSALHAESAVKACLVLAVCIAAAAVVAAGVARFTNAVVGLFTLGVGLFVLTSRLADVQDLVLNDARLGLLAVELLLLAALLLGAAVVVFAAAGPLPDVHPPRTGGPPVSRFGLDALVAAAAGAAVLPIVWFFAKSTMKGQMVGSVFIGAMAAGMIGRMIRPNVQPVLLFVSPMVFGAVGYVLAMVFLRSPLDEAFVDGTLSPLVRPMPLDYAAGTLTGVAVGLGWAKSFLAHQPEEDPGRPAAAV